MILYQLKNIKTILIYLPLLLLFITSRKNAVAQPANNNCVSATTLTVKTTDPDSCVNGTTVGSTVEGGETTNCNGGDNQTVWYKFTATTAITTVTILGDAGNNCAMGSEVWNGSVGCMPITSISCVNSTTRSHGHDLTTLVPGTVYYVQVTYGSGGPCGTGALFCIDVISTPTSNDNCANAKNVSDGTLYLGTNVSATPDKDLCSGSTENNIWFYWTVPANWTLGDSAFVHLFNQKCDRTDGMQMSVFDRDNCALIPDPAALGDCIFSANTVTDTDIYFAWVPTAIGNIYYFDLDGYGGTVCNFNFIINNTKCLTLAAKGSVSASCGNNDGTAFVTATNSTAPYTFKWSTNGTVTNTTTTSINASLAPGVYTFTITDANGCRIWDTLRVFPPVFADWSFNGDSCLATNSIQFEHVGTGNECTMSCPTFYWNFGDGTTSTAEDPTKTYATAGTKTVLHYVDNGTCRDTIIKTVTIIDCSCPLVSNAGTDTSVCTGATYIMQGSYTGAATTLTTLSSGAINLAIPDNNATGVSSNLNNATSGCAVSSVCATITHGWNDDMDIYLTCPSGTQIELSTDNGSSGDNYAGACYNRTAAVNINTLSGVVTNNISGNWLPEQALSLLDGCASNGNWTLTVKDDAMFIAGTLNSWSITYDCPSAVTVKWTPGTYLSSTTTLTPTFTAPATVGSYTYTLSVTDSRCTKYDQVTINVISCGCPVISVAMVGTNLLCNGVCIGAATGTGSGGAAPYTYKWASGQTTQTISSLCAGTYTVTAKDANNCKGFSSVTITQPAPLTAVFTKGVATCATCICKNWALFNVTGGTLPRTYIWSDGYTYRYQNELCPGTFTASVTDVNGCKAGATVTVP